MYMTTDGVPKVYKDGCSALFDNGGKCDIQPKLSSAVQGHGTEHFLFYSYRRRAHQYGSKDMGQSEPECGGPSGV